MSVDGGSARQVLGDVDAALVETHHVHSSLARVLLEHSTNALALCCVLPPIWLDQHERWTLLSRDERCHRTLYAELASHVIRCTLT